MLTVNSPGAPLTNSLVPSSGSTHQKRGHPFRPATEAGSDSSESTGISGRKRGELLADEGVRGAVGLRQRRVVGFVLDRDRVAVVVEDDAPGRLGDAADGVEEVDHGNG